MTLAREQCRQSSSGMRSTLGTLTVRGLYSKKGTVISVRFGAIRSDRTELSVLGVGTESPSEMLCPTDGDLPSKVERALHRGKAPL